MERLRAHKSPEYCPICGGKLHGDKKSAESGLGWVVQCENERYIHYIRLGKSYIYRKAYDLRKSFQSKKVA